MRYPCAMVILPQRFAAPGVDDFLISEEKRLRRFVTSSSSSLLYALGPPLRDMPLQVRGSTGPSGLAIHAPPPGSALAHNLAPPQGGAARPAESPLQMFVSDTGRDVCVEAIVRRWPDVSAPLIIREFGGFGTGPGQLVGPGDLCVAPAEGLLLIAEACGLTAFHLGGTMPMAYKVGAKGSGPGAFKGVEGLAPCAGELYCCDSGNHRIQVLKTADGSFVREFGGKGDAPGLFRKPAAIVVLDAASPAADLHASRASIRVIVGETTGKRVQVCTAFGAPLQLISTLMLPSSEIDARDDEHRAQASGGAAPAARIACFAVDAERRRLYAATQSANSRLYVWRLLPPRGEGMVAAGTASAAEQHPHFQV